MLQHEKISPTYAKKNEKNAKHSEKKIFFILQAQNKLFWCSESRKKCCDLLEYLKPIIIKFTQYVH